MRLLRGAVHARAGAQPKQRADLGGTTAACGVWLYGSAVPWTDRELLRGPIAAKDAEPAICNHVHLPVQSGSARVLRAMRRTYSRDEYLERIALIRSAKRPTAITTDVIVGFPGETDSDFDETLSLLDEVKFDGVFSFKYSPRPNTSASTMLDAIPEEEKSRRLGLLQEKQRVIQSGTLQSLVGEVYEVHVDGKSKKENSWYGHSACNRVVSLTAMAENLLGQYVRARVTGCTANSLLGEHIG